MSFSSAVVIVGNRWLWSYNPRGYHLNQREINVNVLLMYSRGNVWELINGIGFPVSGFVKISLSLLVIQVLSGRFITGRCLHLSHLLGFVVQKRMGMLYSLGSVVFTFLTVNPIFIFFYHISLSFVAYINKSKGHINHFRQIYSFLK